MEKVTLFLRKIRTEKLISSVECAKIMENIGKRNQAHEVDIPKRILVKLNIGLAVLLLGVLFCCRTVSAETKDAFDYMTEIHVEDSVWKYGETELKVSVAKDEAVSVQCLLNFIKQEWAQVYREGAVKLSWSLPNGVEIVGVSQGISAKLNDQWVPVGKASVTLSKISIEIQENYRQVLADSTSTDFQIRMLLKFPEGEFNLDDKVIVDAAEIGSSKVTWNHGEILVNVIDAQEESKLLGNARIEIREAQYAKDTRFGNAELFSQLSAASIATGTYLYDNVGIVSIEDQKADVYGGFDPGNLYYVTEVTPPVGYLPVEPEVKIGFYYYDGVENTGTAKKYAELNAPFTKRYEDEGAVAVFGLEEGYGTIKEPNVYIKNKKISAIQVKKVDALTGDAMKDVKMTLQIPAASADYPFSEYQKLGWTQNTDTQTYQLSMTTDKSGMITFTEGTVPYCANPYELVETVPEGYAGYGGTLTTRFQMKVGEDLSIDLVSESGESMLENGVLVIENEPVADVKITKTNDDGKTLSGAVFAVYSEHGDPQVAVLEKSGKTYYKQQELTTEKDGIALFRGLPEGTCYIVEEKAPNGYQKLKEPIEISITKDLLKKKAEDRVYPLSVKNTKTGTPLINTGGKGVFRNLLIGAVLLIAGGVLFVIANKKKLRKMLIKAKRRAQQQKRQSGRPKKRSRSSGQRRPSKRPPQRRSNPPQRRKQQRKRRR